MTPRQDAAIRRQLALIPAYGWTAYMWSVFLEQSPVGAARNTAVVFRDFIHFYILGLLTRVHAVHLLYDPAAQHDLMLQLFPAAPNVTIAASFAPYVGLFFAPIAGGSYVDALIAWLAVSIVVSVACIYAMWRLCPGLSHQKWPVAVLSAGAPALHLNLMYGQIAILELMPFIAAYWALCSDASREIARSPGRQILAGICFGLLFIKPHLALGAAALIIGAGQWWIVLGALVSIAAQLLVGVGYWGWYTLVEYVHVLIAIPGTVAGREPDIRQLHDWRSFFQLLGTHGWVLTAAVVTASVATLAIALICWRTAGDLRLRYSTLLMATALVSPHTYTYDMVILLPAGFLLWDYAADASRAGHRDRARWVAAAALVVYAAPMLGFLAAAIHVQLSVPLLLGGATLATSLVVTAAARSSRAQELS